MSYYVHALAYALGYGAVFVTGVICGILHERHHLHLPHRRRLERP